MKQSALALALVVLALVVLALVVLALVVLVVLAESVSLVESLPPAAELTYRTY